MRRGWQPFHSCACAFPWQSVAQFWVCCFCCSSGILHRRHRITRFTGCFITADSLFLCHCLCFSPVKIKESRGSYLLLLGTQLILSPCTPQFLSDLDFIQKITRAVVFWFNTCLPICARTEKLSVFSFLLSTTLLFKIKVYLK